MCVLQGRGLRRMRVKYVWVFLSHFSMFGLTCLLLLLLLFICHQPHVAPASVRERIR